MLKDTLCLQYVYALCTVKHMSFQSSPRKFKTHNAYSILYLHLRYFADVDKRYETKQSKKQSKVMRCQTCQILCFPCSSVEVRPQVQQLGNCKEVRNKKMDRECERFLLLLSCCFEVSVFEKSEWTAQAEWCKNLAMSSAFHIALMSKYDGWSVMNAVCIQLHSQVQCFQSDKRALKENA